MLTVIISFLTAVLAGMGVGSGGVLVVYLTLALSMEQTAAQLLNLIFFVASSLAALAVNAVKKRLRLGIILPLSLIGCVTAAGTAALTREIEGRWLSRSFGGLLVILGVISFVSTLKNAKKYRK